MTNPIDRQNGKNKIDSLYLNASKWYIDGKAVTASAESLNTGNNSDQSVFIVLNITGGTITAGMPLHINGYSAPYNCYTVEKADASSKKPCQLFAQATIAEGAKTTASLAYKGVGNGVDCRHATLGSPVYLNETAGTVTLYPPIGESSFIQIVGRVADQNNPGTLALDARYQEIVEISSQQIVPTTFSSLPETNPNMSEDYFLISDGLDSGSKRISGIKLAEGLAGRGLQAQNGQLSLDGSRIYDIEGLLITKYSGEIDFS